MDRRTDELAVLQSQLATRASTLHFAHAAISLLLGLIAAGAGAKMMWDFELDEAVWVAPVSVISVTLLLYGAVRYTLGRRALRSELSLFSRFVELRQALGLDDPSMLLPQ